MQKGSALIILTLFFAVLILAGISGWYYLNNKTPRTVPAKPEPVHTPSAKPQSTSYENSDLGIKLTLPLNYQVKEESEEEYFKRAYGDIRKNFTYYVQYPPAEFVNSYYFLKKGESDPENAALSLVVFKNPDNLTPEAFYNKYWYYPFVWGEFSSSEKAKVAPKTVEIISGKEGSSAIVHYRDADPKFIYLPIPGEGIMYQLHLPTENNKSGEEILKSLVID